MSAGLLHAEQGIRAAIQICHKAAVAAGRRYEAVTADLMDDKLPNRPRAEVALADALIRAFEYAGAQRYDLAGAVVEKLAYNSKVI